jgi:hypothetical protein
MLCLLDCEAYFLPVGGAQTSCQWTRYCAQMLKHLGMCLHLPRRAAIVRVEMYFSSSLFEIIMLRLSGKRERPR